MPVKKKKTPPVSPAKMFIRKLVRYAAVLLAALLVWMVMSSGVVQLRFAELPIKSLPSSFIGTRILYLSDLHINSLNTVDKVNALMNELMTLNPDMLILGGDYTSLDPIMRITGASSDARAVETEMRDLFFLNLSSYSPPLGKYGVAGENDNLLERSAGTSLKDAMSLGGVTLLRDEAVRISKGTDSLVLVGVDDWSTGHQDTRTPAALAHSSDCVILICHNPEAIPSLNNQPAVDGIWIDAALTGHTHGGGVNLFGHSLFNPLGSDARFQSGWHLENSAKVLISNGVGNDFLPLRLNASPEAHLITLVQYSN